MITFNPTPGGSDKVQIEVNYFDLVEPETADANGIVKAIKTSFEQVNIDYLEKLVGFGSDGASVNRGEKDGIKGEGNSFFSTMRKMPGCIRTNPTKQKNITLFTSESI